MQRYYFQVYNSTGVTPDSEGLLYEDIEAAKEQAVQSIRSILAEELKVSGQVDLRGRIEIKTEEGTITTVRFGDAVQVLGVE